MSVHTDEKLREEIAAAVTQSFGHKVHPDDVLDVARYGSVSEGNVSPEFDEAKSEAILEEFDRRDIQI